MVLLASFLPPSLRRTVPSRRILLFGFHRDKKIALVDFETLFVSKKLSSITICTLIIIINEASWNLIEHSIKQVVHINWSFATFHTLVLDEKGKSAQNKYSLILRDRKSVV